MSLTIYRREGSLILTLYRREGSLILTLYRREGSLSLTLYRREGSLSHTLYRRELELVSYHFGFEFYMHLLCHYCTYIHKMYINITRACK